jgi:hypothetical protein
MGSRDSRPTRPPQLDPPPSTSVASKNRTRQCGHRIPPEARQQSGIRLGSKGLGNGTFAAFYANYPAESTKFVAEVAFPSRDPRETPFKARCELSVRCCSFLFNGELRVPVSASGLARVKLSMPNWPGHPVRSATFSVPVNR